MTLDYNTNIKEAIHICRNHSPYDVIIKVGAIYSYNKEPANYLAPAHVIKFVICHCDPNCHERIPLPLAARLISLLNEIEDLLVPGRFLLKLQQKEAIIARKLWSALQYQPELLASATTSITNPGTAGEQIIFAVKKFSSSKELLVRQLGFDIESATLTIMILTKYGAECLNGLPDKTKEKYVNLQKRTIHNLFLPPVDFLKAWEDATVIDIENLGTHPYGYPLDKNVIDFLSTDILSFKSDPRSFNRWAFLRLPDGRYLLLLNTTLRECLLSSVHFELIKSLDKKESGEFTRRIGKVFETVVIEEIKTRWKKANVIGRQDLFDDRDIQIGDIDSTVSFGTRKIIIECKGGALRPQGRWGSIEYLVYDIKRTVDKAINQLQKIRLAKPEVWEGVELTFIVLDIYVPYLTTYFVNDARWKEMTKDLPETIVLTYYDLRYLLWRLNELEFYDYIEWRKAYLKNAFCMPFDEMDLVYTYYYHRDEIDLSSSDPPVAVYIPDDYEYEVSTREECLHILGLSREFIKPFNKNQ